MISSETSLPSDLAEFVRRHIDRLETLEVLLLLASGDRVWTARQVSDEMRSSPLAAKSTMDTLVAHGLLVQDSGGYRFSPRRAELEDQIRRLAVCYRSRRTAVITAIFSSPRP